MTDLIKALREQGHADSKTEYWTGWNDALNSMSSLLRERQDGKPVQFAQDLKPAPPLQCKAGPGYVHFRPDDQAACLICHPTPLHETHVCRECGAVITIPYVKPDPDSPQWEACKVCGGDHWTKDHPETLTEKVMREFG